MFRTVTATDGLQLCVLDGTGAGVRRGGLVILQEIFGVTDQLKGVARHWHAAQGIEVAIPALFDRQERDAVIPFDQGARGRALMLASDLEATMRDVAAAVAALGGPVAVMGFCWGGGLALRAAQVLDIACGVSFYGTSLPHGIWTNRWSSRCRGISA
ncbi:dienelactone hydrolase family protein [Novosphingobium sp. MW5]|nr:dienelactone hydrolase family protein [Novosphingobium sp. MW5]